MADAEHNWCAGLGVTRSRSLSVAELQTLRLRRRLTIVRALAWLFGIPVLLLLMVWAAAIATPSAPQESFTETLMVILAILIIFLGVPLCITIASDCFKRAGVLKRQCRDLKVLVCEGSVADLIAKPRELKKLRQQIGHSSEVVLEILMQSGLVWAVNGRPQASWLVAPRGRTAGAPEHARLAAQFVRPVETNDGGTSRLHQRLLSEQECSELQACLPRITLTGGLVALILNAIAVGHLLAYIRNPGGVPLAGIFFMTLAGWRDAQLVFALRARLRMLRDLRERFVVIYQTDPAVAAAETAVEFLPHSGAEWTTGGRAAPWRRLHGPTD